jgi:hypothetical protein
VGDLTRSAETDPLIPTQPSQRLTEAIRSLSEAKRLIVTFYYYGGLTTEEITFLLSRTEYRVHKIHASAVSSPLTKVGAQTRIHEPALCGVKIGKRTISAASNSVGEGMRS